MKRKNITYGILFVLAGVVLVLNNLGIFGNINFFSVILSMVLLALSISGFVERNFYKGLFPLAFIGIIFDKELGITSITPWTLLLATLLASIGLSIIFGKKIRKPNKWNYISNNYNGEYKVTFGETVKYVTGEVDKVDVSCFCGTLDIYLDNATFKNAKVEININVNCGEVRMYIPKNCRVTNNIDEILSSTNIKGSSSDVQVQDVIVTGRSVMSSIDIIYI